MTDAVSAPGGSNGISAGTQLELDEIQKQKEADLVRFKKDELRNEQMTKLSSNLDKVRF